MLVQKFRIIQTLNSNIFAKTNLSAKPFLPVYQVCSMNLVTLPL